MNRFRRRQEAKRACKKAGGKLKIKGTVKELAILKNEIAFWTLEEQAEYVDGVAKENADNFFMIMDGINSMKNKSDLELYQTMNTTSIGNLAFIILNTRYEDIIPQLKEILQRCKDYIVFIGKEPK